MDGNPALEHNPQVHQFDGEIDRLVARVEQLRAELGQAEEELRAYQDKEMEARRTALTGEARPEPQTEE